MHRHLYALTVLLLIELLVSHNTQQQQQCSESALSLFHSLSCTDGLIGYGPTCECVQEECRVAHMRSYLPSPSAFKAIDRNQTLRECDSQLMHALTKTIKTWPKVITGKGYPLHIRSETCSLQENIASLLGTRRYHPCSVSIGKFLRYNSLYLYSRLISNHTLLNIAYPFEWRWAQGVDSCQKSTFRGWNCVFESVTTLGISEGATPLSPRIPPIVLSAVKSLLFNKKNHAVQIIFYGRMLGILAQPSTLIKSFMAENMVTQSPLSSSNNNIVSVSMHVRQGDSCDVVVNSKYDLDSYAERGYKRTCFHLDVYISKLHQLREMYGVNRVYLATDSHDMIIRTEAEPSFEWVYINTSREVFKYANGWVDYFSNGRNELVTLSAAADLQLMQRGDIFVGAFSSHFSKLSFYLMAGARMRIPPFISLDHPLSCDTVDSCSESDIASRIATIEDIIKWAPECVRKSGGGWIEEYHDPCGIYGGHDID